MTESSLKNSSVLKLSRPLPETVTELPSDADRSPEPTYPVEKLSDRPQQSSRSTLSHIHPALLIAFSVLPYWLIPISHVVANPETATGFFHEELPYYIANGRAAFDRGNGLTYPNPYDPDPAAPAIYAHWLLWLLGILPAWLLVDPGDLVVGLTLLTSLGFAFLTWQLLKTRLSPAPVPTAAFVLAMWGGGLLVVAGFAAGSTGSTEPYSSLLQFDPGRGLWFLNWGRNSLFVTESVYHIIVAGCWISEMRGQRAWGTLWCALLATTHPWSGLELLLTLNLWRTLQWYQKRDRDAGIFCAVSIAMLAGFLGYYRIWLPQFPHHLKLQQVWELDWSLSWRSAALAYLPVLIPAVARILQGLTAADREKGSTDEDRRLAGVQGESVDLTRQIPANSQSSLQRVGRLDRAERFLLCAVAVSAFLIFHDRWMKPVQPLHFTRGYLWMPLFLIGLPTLLRWISRSNWVLSAGLIVLLSIDNLTFSAIHSRWQWQGTTGLHLDVHDRAILRHMHERFPGQLILTQSDSLNYLTPAYANLRPWVGHIFNTPDYKLRKQTVDNVFAAGKVQPDMIPAEVDVLVIRRTSDDDALRRSSSWTFVESRNAEWNIWSRVHIAAFSPF
jgi:hypothetical protein